MGFYGGNVGITMPYTTKMTGNGEHQLSMVMTGGWFIIVIPTLGFMVGK